jgi:hypothetical protein
MGGVSEDKYTAGGWVKSFAQHTKDQDCTSTNKPAEPGGRPASFYVPTVNANESYGGYATMDECVNKHGSGQLVADHRLLDDVRDLMVAHERVVKERDEALAYAERAVSAGEKWKAELVAERERAEHWYEEFAKLESSRASCCSEMERLRNWKNEASLVFKPVLEFEHKELQLGESRITFLLRLANERDRLRAALEVIASNGSGRFRKRSPERH